MKLANTSYNKGSHSVIAKTPKIENVAFEAKVSSSVLQRLMQEVKNDAVNNISAYNRTHNRHNRGR